MPGQRQLHRLLLPSKWMWKINTLEKHLETLRKLSCLNSYLSRHHNMVSEMSQRPRTCVCTDYRSARHLNVMINLIMTWGRIQGRFLVPRVQSLGCKCFLAQNSLFIFKINKSSISVFIPCINTLVIDALLNGQVATAQNLLWETS